MTALTMPARPDEAHASLRPVPWRRMAGVTWRQHRFALVGVAVLLGVLAVWLWIVGTSMHHAYAAAVTCLPASSPACENLVNTFNGMDTFVSNGVILQVLPAAIGAFVGAPLLARRWRPAPSGSPGLRASAGGAGRSASWCRSRSR